MKKFNNGQKVQSKEKGIGRIVDGYDLNDESVYQVKWLNTNLIEKFVSEKELQSFNEECKFQAFFNKIFRSGKSGKIVKIISFVIFVYLLVLLILTIK